MKNNKDLCFLGIPEKKENQLIRAGIENMEDLLNYFPRKYLDFREDTKVKDFVERELVGISGKLLSKTQGNKTVNGVCESKDGEIFRVVWFNQPYIYQKINEGKEYFFTGTVGYYFDGSPQLSVNSFNGNIGAAKKIVPVYKKIRGMSDEYLVSCINKALDLYSGEDYLEDKIIDLFKLPSMAETYRCIHRPKTKEDIVLGQKRRDFNSLFAFSLISRANNPSVEEGSVFISKDFSIWNEIDKAIPFELTKDQRKVLDKSKEALLEGKRMAGLVQGDVGSGKTIVAFYFLALARDNGYQTALIAPTEVLARQHYEDAIDTFKGLGLNVAYLSGTTKAKERRRVLEELANGEINILIGTHALFQDKVVYNNLGLLIIDEQHRFGVEQRGKLLDVDDKPHVFIMSATPIPRTLSLAIYGDGIEVFEIKTKPKGRLEIITKKVKNPYDGYELMLDEIKKGRQAYVVCPLIEDSDHESMAEVQSVESAYEEINKYFKPHGVKVEQVNGSMKQKEIDAIVDSFSRGEIGVLISTTIIEVGVNVPNASLMLIKNSERFGLAQAHQLRGRVGRGKYQSYCLLETKKNDVKADILCNTSDGFKIAEEDLALRGSGNFIGTKQSGDDENFNLMINNPNLFKRISMVVNHICSKPKLFERYKHIIIEHEEKLNKKNKK